MQITLILAATIDASVLSLSCMHACALTYAQNDRKQSVRAHLVVRYSPDRLRPAVCRLNILNSSLPDSMCLGRACSRTRCALHDTAQKIELMARRWVDIIQQPQSARNDKRCLCCCRCRCRCCRRRHAAVWRRRATVATAASCVHCMPLRGIVCPCVQTLTLTGMAPVAR